MLPVSIVVCYRSVYYIVICYRSVYYHLYYSDMLPVSSGMLVYWSVSSQCIIIYSGMLSVSILYSGMLVYWSVSSMLPVSVL